MFTSFISSNTSSIPRSERILFAILQLGKLCSVQGHTLSKSQDQNSDPSSGAKPTLTLMSVECLPPASAFLPTVSDLGAQLCPRQEQGREEGAEGSKA